MSQENLGGVRGVRTPVVVPPGTIRRSFDGVHRGHDGYRRVWKRVLEVMEDVRLDYEEVIDFGDQVFACGRMSAHGNLSGIPVSGGLFQLFTLRGGLVVRQEDFAHRDAAFNTVGLRE